MNTKGKNYLSLLLWIIALVATGSSIGFCTRFDISTWHNTLNRSPLTPPNYVFPITWTILYTVIGICGWFIWQSSLFPRLRVIKLLYAIQLVLNWSWMPLFFHYHLTGLSLLVLVIIAITVISIIYLTYSKIKSVSLMMIPYLLWVLFASHLNFYIWQHN